MSQWPSILERFLARVERGDPNDCWEWQGPREKHGYGTQLLGADGKNIRPHQFAYQQFVGDLDGMTVDHLCFNKACVNPWHLEAVPLAENIRRGNARARSQRTHCRRGHPYNEENTRVIPSRPNARYCRACNRDWHAKRKAA